MTLKRILFILLVGFAQIGFTQQSSFIQYDTKDGLAQSQVRTILQSENGYIWFGTQGGLSRFDGFEFVNYSTEDGLPANQINCLLETDQRLWIGSKGSLAYIEGNEIELIPLPEAYHNTRILDLELGNEEDLFVALAGGGLLKYQSNTFTHYGEEEGLPSKYVRTLELSPSGELWIGTSSGGRVLTKDNQIEQAHPELATRSISDFLFTPDGKKIVCTFGLGVFEITDESSRHFLQSDGLQSNHIRAAGQLPSGEIWFGAKEGLSVFDGSTITVYDESNGLPYSNIKSLTVDREGNLWLGTDGKGALLQAGRAFTNYTSAVGLGSDLILSVCKYHEEDMLFGSYDAGIFIFHGDSVTAYPYNDELPNYTVWVVKHAPNNAIWAGTTSGLYIEKGGKHIVLNEENGLPGNRVTALALDEDGFWVGVEKGFAKVNFDGLITASYTDSSGFAGTNIRSLKWADNTLWIGARQGLYTMKNGEIEKHIINPEEEASLYSLELDNLDRIWIGTNNGLYVSNKDSVSVSEIEFDRGVSAKNINFLQSLSDGTLLVGTNNGLYRLNKELGSSVHEFEVKHFTYFEGLKSTETNQNSNYLAGEVLWFGTTSGVVRFDPEIDLSQQETAPALNITEVQLFLNETDWDKFSDSTALDSGLPLSPILPHNQNYITFNFSGISLSNPDKVNYRYTLIGADETWLGPTKSRSVTYAYLPHGDYSFKLESFSEDAPLSISEASFDFSITPPFYLTTWFFIAAGLFLALVFYLLYLNRVKKESEKRANLQLKFQSRLMELESQSLNSSMNRHFIFNSLNSIQYYINMQDRKSANRYLTSFAKLIRKNLDSSQQNETSLKDELDRLELYLSLEQMRFQGRFDYEISISPDVNVEDITIPAMMLQPFLENSIWHGILPSEKHGELEVHISEMNQGVEIEIKDNGIGVETSKSLKAETENGHISQGMDITQNRIQLYKNMTGLNYEIKGPYEIKNGSPENILGTVVTIRIPNKFAVSN